MNRDRDPLYQSLLKVLSAPTTVPGSTMDVLDIFGLNRDFGLLPTGLGARILAGPVPAPLIHLPQPKLPRNAVALKDELVDATAKIFREGWDKRDGAVVPDPEDLRLGNDAVILDATVLYADMSGSTEMVDEQQSTLAAEVYKAYLGCAARIIKSEGGSITAYDGDRIMAVFIGSTKNTSAAKAALKVNWAVSSIVNAGLRKQYGDNAYQMRHVIGVDTSNLLASRIGVRNDNDLVWVGRAANYAAKLTEINEGYPVFITGDVFDKLHQSSKYGGNPPSLMWEKRFWTKMNNRQVYRSNWTWSL